MDLDLACDGQGDLPMVATVAHFSHFIAIPNFPEETDADLSLSSHKKHTHKFSR